MGETARSPISVPAYLCGARHRTGSRVLTDIGDPQLGVPQLDWDVLTTHRNDLRVVIYTAAPGNRSAKVLEELSALDLRGEPSAFP